MKHYWQHYRGDGQHYGSFWGLFISRKTFNASFYQSSVDKFLMTYHTHDIRLYHRVEINGASKREAMRIAVEIAEAEVEREEKRNENNPI